MKTARMSKLATRPLSELADGLERKDLLPFTLLISPSCSLRSLGQDRRVTESKSDLLKEFASR